MEFSPQFTTSIYSYAALFAIIEIISLCQIFKKAGQPGWAAIVPFYNIIIWLRIISKPGWWLILLFIPGVNIIILIGMTNLLAKAFGRKVGFTLGLIFLSIIFYPLLAFKDYKYLGNIEQQSNSVSDSELARDKMLVWSLGLLFLNVVYWTVFSNFIKEWWTYYYIITPVSVLLLFAYFLIGISVNNKYRTISITLSICILIIYCVKDLLPELRNLL